MAFIACTKQEKKANQSAEQKQESTTSAAPSDKSEPNPQKKASAKKEKNAPPKLSNENVKAFLTRYGQKHSAGKFKIATAKGDIVIRLFENTPLHRANFLYLTQQGYWNNTWFYRVSKGHVIQAGNTDEQATLDKRIALGDYTVPAEIGKHHHATGAVAMVRSYKNNPNKRSDPYEFYITLGEKYSAAELRAMEKQQDFDFNQRQEKLYITKGGAPHLDGEHTVFGKVIEGMEVVRAISKVEVDPGEWPLDNIPIQVKVFESKQ